MSSIDTMTKDSDVQPNGHELEVLMGNTVRIERVVLQKL